MNLKTTNTFLLILLTIVSTVLIWVSLKPIKSISSASTARASAVTRDQAENRVKALFWNYYPTLIVPTDNMPIADTTTLLRDDGKVFKLKDLAQGKDRLIFRYSSFDCEICVDSVTTIIQRITKNDKLDQLILITDTKNERDFFIKAKNKTHPYPIYTLGFNTLKLPFENKNLPFLFILTKESRTSKIFVPMKEFGDQTTQYIKYAFKFLK